MIMVVRDIMEGIRLSVQMLVKMSGDQMDQEDEDSNEIPDNPRT